MPRKKTVVEQEIDEIPEAVVIEEVFVAKEPAATVEAVKPDLKTQIQKLIEEAPNLSEVQHNPWTYTEWLAKLNGAVLRA
jgi:D-ribose pyranose/furanose isomerase RbsD